MNQRRAPARSRSRAVSTSDRAARAARAGRRPRRRAAPSKASRVATSTLRKPWCSKPSLAGVPDGAVQPGGALERRLAVERRVDPARPARAAAGKACASSPPVRNFSRSSAAATSSAAASQAPVELDVRELDVDRHVVVEHALGAGGVDGGDHPAGVAGQVVGVAQRDLEARDGDVQLAAPAPAGAGDLPGAAGDHDRQRERRCRAGAGRSVSRTTKVPTRSAYGVAPAGLVRGRGLVRAARRRAGRSRRRRPGRARRVEAVGPLTRGYSNHEAHSGR